MHASPWDRARSSPMQATSILHTRLIHNSLNSIYNRKGYYTHTHTHTHTHVYNMTTMTNLNDTKLRTTTQLTTMVCHDTCSSYSSCCCTGPYATFSFSLML